MLPCWLAGWLAGLLACLLARLVAACLDAWLVGWLVAFLLACLLSCLLSYLIAWLFACLLACLLACSCLPACLFVAWFASFVVQPGSRMVDFCLFRDPNKHNNASGQLCKHHTDAGSTVSSNWHQFSFLAPVPWPAKSFVCFNSQEKQTVGSAEVVILFCLHMHPCRAETEQTA